MSAAVTTKTDVTVADQLSTAIVGLEPGSAVALRSAFESMFAQADEWVARAREIRVTSEDDKRGMRFARESRLALREIRVNAEKARKRLKEDSVRQGRAIDGIANVIKGLIEPIEAHLLEQETFAARAEESRRDALRDARATALIAYGADPSAYSDLGAMAEEVWSSTLDSARLAHEAKIEAAKQAELVRVEAERIAAAKREADRQERARLEADRAAREQAQAEENARLRAEAAKREEAAKVERERIESERAAERANVQAEAAAREAESRAKREAAEAEARKARVAAESAAAELATERKAARDRDEAAAARVAADEAARQAAELAPDREKLLAFAAAIRAMPIPALTTERGLAATSKVSDQVAKVALWIEKTAGAL